MCFVMLLGRDMKGARADKELLSCAKKYSYQRSKVKGYVRWCKLRESRLSCAGCKRFGRLM